ncbi:APC family permease [Alkalihalophilus lindianensis]|uniref:APC family permease n=1 Tax=Alkalihalophilus lindianensis TaxID=1630542 RepID=A0ABU3XEK6_9BACI|nr:APC family permease [Alkalihalophilus lindianensis]MDV2686314.1 APC family permease [Alkalihalophilus lindianensis]
MSDQANSPRLQRQLKLIHVIAIGIAYMSPFAVFDTFGIASEASGGYVPASYIVVFVAILFTALSYGKLVQKYPMSGSVYTYTRHVMNSYLGVIVGWVTFLAYLALPMINALLANIYLSSGFPNVPGTFWVIGLIVLITVFNIFGVKLAASVNVLLVMFQFLVGSIFIYLNIRAINSDGAHHYITFQSLFPENLEMSPLLTGAALLALSFIGFDAITTLSEETINPRKTIPKAILIVASIGGFFFFTVTYFMQSLFPDVSVFNDIEGASPEIAFIIGNNLFLALFISGALVSVFASGLAAQLSASRLLFSMGRDKVIPKSFFGYIHPKHKTPLLNIILIGLLALMALFLDLESATSLVNFGAFTAFSFVNICVIALFLKSKQSWTVKNILSNILAPSLGLIFIFYLWISLDLFSIMIGLIWTTLGLIYLALSTSFFTKAPPEIKFDELDM